MRELLRLCNELHNATDEGDSRKLKLLEGVRRLADADGASVSVIAFDRERGEPQVVSTVDTHGNGNNTPWELFRKELRHGARATVKVAPSEWCTTARWSGRWVSPRAYHCVHSVLPLVGNEVVACLTVRRTANRPRFNGRDRSIVCTFHAEAGWIYRADVILVSPDTRSLSRREKQTLAHLLAGKGEKQIAAALGLSVNTIHHYVKALHRHFTVSSRSELLARWVGR